MLDTGDAVTGQMRVAAFLQPVDERYFEAADTPDIGGRFCRQCQLMVQCFGRGCGCCLDIYTPEAKTFSVEVCYDMLRHIRWICPELQKHQKSECRLQCW